MKVMLVDDEPPLLEIGKEFLEMEGDLEVRTFESAEEALNELDREHFDAIVSDYQMPGMDGLQFLGEVRSRNADLPFIIFTGKGREEVVIEALNKGADHYIRKGADMESEFSLLAHMIRQSVQKWLAEEAVEHNARRFRRMIENIQDIIAVIDAKGIIQYVSPSVTRLHGYPQDEVMGRPLTDFVVPDDKERVESDLRRCLNGEVEAGTVEFRVTIPTGEYRIMDGNWSVMREGANGTEILLTVRDITERVGERKELERAIHALDASIDGTAILNEDQVYIYMNQAHAEIYGYSDPEELLGQTWRVLYDGDEVQRIDEEIIPILQKEGKWRGEAVGKRKDGTRFPQEVSLTVLEEGGLICVVRNISEKKSVGEVKRSPESSIPVSSET